VWSLIDDSSSCETDADCVIVDLGCPFGCGVGLNVDKVDSVIEITNEYHQEFGRCLFLCAAPEAVQCISNSCVMYLYQ